MAVVAEFVSEGSDGKLTIGGIFDRIHVQNFPIKYPRLCAVAEFEARVYEGSEHLLELSFVDEDGKHIITPSPPIPLSFQPVAAGRPLRARFIGVFEGVQFDREGDYELNFKIDSNHVISIPVIVTLFATG